MLSQILAFPYFFLLFFILLCQIYEVYLSQCVYNKIGRYASFIKIAVQILPYYISFVFLAFRGEVNTDWVTYQAHYECIASTCSPVGFAFENAFWWGLYLFKVSGLDYSYFQVASTFFDLLLVYLIGRYYRFGLIFLFMYLVFNGGVGFRLEVNLMRQVKSILFFTISVKYLQKGSLFKYVSINLLGSLFHVTSLIYIPLYFILRRRNSNFTLVFLYVVGFFFFIFEISWVSKVLTFLSDYSFGRLSFLANVYSNSEIFSQRKELGFALIERSMLFFSVFYLAYKSKINFSHIYLNICFLYIFIYLYFSEMIIFSDRFSLLFLPGFWLAYSSYYTSAKLKSKIIFLLLFFLYIFIKHFGFTAPVYLKYNQFIY
ncbi:EpsG family protein [Aeromonas caviae]|uniref:EpsG family protein n=1 Tax=Aeromonas caviae TaxID=648 RepID=UPI0038733B94